MSFFTTLFPTSPKSITDFKYGLNIANTTVLRLPDCAGMFRVSGRSEDLGGKYTNHKNELPDHKTVEVA